MNNLSGKDTAGAVVSLQKEEAAGETLPIKRNRPSKFEVDRWRNTTANRRGW